MQSVVGGEDRNATDGIDLAGLISFLDATGPVGVKESGCDCCLNTRQVSDVIQEDGTQEGEEIYRCISFLGLL